MSEKITKLVQCGIGGLCIIYAGIFLALPGASIYMGLINSDFLAGYSIENPYVLLAIPFAVGVVIYSFTALAVHHFSTEKIPLGFHPCVMALYMVFISLINGPIFEEAEGVQFVKTADVISQIKGTAKNHWAIAEAEKMLKEQDWSGLNRFVSDFHREASHNDVTQLKLIDNVLGVESPLGDRLRRSVYSGYIGTGEYEEYLRMLSEEVDFRNRPALALLGVSPAL